MKVLITTILELGGKAESVEVIYEKNKETYSLNLNTIEDEIDIIIVQVEDRNANIIVLIG